MTMLCEKKNSIWNQMRQDKDIDDMIFESEPAARKEAVVCSER